MPSKPASAQPAAAPQANTPDPKSLPQPGTVAHTVAVHLARITQRHPAPDAEDLRLSLPIIRHLTGSNSDNAVILDHLQTWAAHGLLRITGKGSECRVSPGPELAFAAGTLIASDGRVTPTSVTSIFNHARQAARPAASPGAPAQAKPPHTTRRSTPTLQQVLDVPIAACLPPLRAQPGACPYSALLDRLQPGQGTVHGLPITWAASLARAITRRHRNTLQRYTLAKRPAQGLCYLYRLDDAPGPAQEPTP
jgi:hypothetical protein